MTEPALLILMYAVFPIWVAAGFVDWLCHRHTDIAHSSGWKESLLHWVMFAEVGVGVLAVALFEVNAAVLAIVGTVIAVHEVTVYWDLKYTYRRRSIGPFEQMVHSFLEMLPVVSLALLAIMAWPQTLALAGVGTEAPDWSLRDRLQPWPASYLAGALAAVVLLNALPLLQELIAGLMARDDSRDSQITPRNGKTTHHVH